MAPARKRDSTAYASDDGFVEEDDAPDTKRSKTSKTSKTTSSNPSKATSSNGANTDDNGDPFWDLTASGSRRVTINDFKGKLMVNVREYYEKDGAKRPGKKGISMPMDQFAAFLEVLPAIDQILREWGEKPPKVSYDGVGGVQTGAANDNGGAREGMDEDEDADDKKQNFEATSEEE